MRGVAPGTSLAPWGLDCVEQAPRGPGGLRGVLTGAPGGRPEEEASLGEKAGVKERAEQRRGKERGGGEGALLS